MAKTRAQRKAEQRKREQKREQRAQERATEAEGETQAQHDTQAPISGDVAETEAIIETGARPEDYGEHVVDAEPEAPPEPGSPVPGVVPGPLQPEQAPPEPLAPSRADVGRPDEAEVVEEVPVDESRDERRARREREKEARRKARAKQLKKGVPAEQQAPEKRRGGVIGFIASCWAELKKVQWPDRDTLVQASAVTLIFVVVMAAYLGALDAVFNWLVKQII
jgi:preprotein translocase subunit SecE